MITIISGTNRPDSRTEKVAQSLYDRIGKYTDEAVHYVNLSEIDASFVHPMMYNPEFQHPDLTKLQDEALIPSDKWIIVSPEYNGSYSGIIKVFIDAISIRHKSETFGGKKLGLVGVASGRGGNLRGLDHLTTSLNYMGMTVYPNRLPLSQIHTMMDDAGLNETTTNLIDQYAEGFVKF